MAPPTVPDGPDGPANYEHLCSLIDKTLVELRGQEDRAINKGIFADCPLATNEGMPPSRCILSAPEHWADVLQQVINAIEQLAPLDMATLLLRKGNSVQTVRDLRMFFRKCKEQLSSPNSGNNDEPPEQLRIHKAKQKLRPCVEKALQQYHSALSRNPELTKDRAVYDYLTDNAESEDDPLPLFDSWARYLREARYAANAQKNTSGFGIETRSVVKSKSKNWTKTDRH